MKKLILFWMLLLFSFTPAQAITYYFWRGDKTWAPLNQEAVNGLTTADGPTFDHIHITNDINVGGNVDGVDLSAFKSTYDAHDHGVGDPTQVDYTTLLNIPSTFEPAAHNLLSTSHGDVLADSVAKGDLLVGNATPKWSRLAVGAEGYVLTSQADGTIAWQAIPAGGAAHDITGASHTTSGRTAGQVLQATGATTFDWSTKTLTLTEDLVVEADSWVNQDLTTDSTTTRFGRVGAGIAPSFEIHAASDSLATLAGDSYSSAQTYYRTSFLLRRARNTAASPQAVGSGDWLGDFAWHGHDGSTFVSGADIRAITTEAWDGSHRGSYLSFRVVPTGSTTITEILQITGTGISTTKAVDLGGAASLEIPNAAAPSVDAEGELAWETDDDDLHIYDGAADVVIAGKTKTMSFTILSPSSASDFPLIQFLRAVTITGVRAISVGGTNVVGCLDEYAGDGTTLQAAIDSDWTVTTSELNDTSFTNAALDAGDWLRWHTTSVSGSVASVSITVEFYEQ